MRYGYTWGVVLFSVFVVLAGCSGRNAPQPSYIEMRAVEMNISGIEATKRGDYATAKRAFTSALELNRSVDNRDGELTNLINLSRVHISLGEYDMAEDYLNQASRLAVRVKDVEKESEIYLTLAKLYYLTDRTDDALELVERAIRIDRIHGHRSIGVGLNIKASIHIKNGKIDEAMETLKEAMRFNRKYGLEMELANSYRALAEIKASVDTKKAMDLYRNAYRIDRLLGDPIKISKDLEGMAWIYFREGYLDDAVFLMERVYMVNLYGGRKKRVVSSLDDIISIYEEMGDEEKVLFYRRIKEDIIAYMSDDKGDGLQ